MGSPHRVRTITPGNPRPDREIPSQAFVGQGVAQPLDGVADAVERAFAGQPRLAGRPGARTRAAISSRASGAASVSARSGAGPPAAAAIDAVRGGVERITASAVAALGQDVFAATFLQGVNIFPDIAENAESNFS
ncbi:hypothetical protein [Nonomuraea sp. NPDC052265]|uniref:hypothetical protein n=1 Tax=Nonomuraea sp. NPDC052265 TaxID=3364374 RepID=UPI0037CB4472